MKIYILPDLRSDILLHEKIESLSIYSELKRNKYAKVWKNNLK